MSTVCCPRCRQDIKNAPTVQYLGLSVSVVAGVVEWTTKDELLPLRPKPLELLYEMLLGGSRGAPVPALIRLVKGNGSAVSVHVTALRHWLKDNCLPLEIVNRARTFVLVESD